MSQGATRCTRCGSEIVAYGNRFYVICHNCGQRMRVIGGVAVNATTVNEELRFQHSRARENERRLVELCTQATRLRAKIEPLRLQHEMSLEQARASKRAQARQEVIQSFPAETLAEGRRLKSAWSRALMLFILLMMLSCGLLGYGFSDDNENGCAAMAAAMALFGFAVVLLEHFWRPFKSWSGDYRTEVERQTEKYLKEIVPEPEPEPALAAALYKLRDIEARIERLSL